MDIKRIRVRYAYVLILLSIFKGTVDMNENSLEKSEVRVVLLCF